MLALLLEKIGIKRSVQGPAFSGRKQSRVVRIYEEAGYWWLSWHNEDHTDGVVRRFDTDCDAEDALVLLKRQVRDVLWVTA